MKKIILIALSTLFISYLTAQTRNQKFEEYIAKYSSSAIENQQKYKIPASITLAQGLLESAAGESKLARECNNHFGIKCGSSWYGRSMKADDDAKGECFRCYSHAKESYKDHSEFLQKQRYAFLFDYKITDYKSWAKGLKQAGYATDPKYPDKLIAIIELYELYKFDSQDSAKKQGGLFGHKKEETKEEEKPQNSENLFGYVMVKNNNVKCYELLADDTFENISKESGVSVKKLLYYNDLPKETQLYRGDYVYLKAKKGQADKKNKKHKVKVGESMHSIAQQYGIKLKALYKINDIEYGTPTKAGQTLKLRK